MLKKSLLTVVILGAFVAAGGAQGEEKVEKAKRFQKPQPELVLDAPAPGCRVEATEAQDVMSKSDTNILDQQNSSQLEELGLRPRVCYWTRFGWICF